MEDYGGEWRKRVKGTGNKKHKSQEQNRQGEITKSVESGEAKECIYMTHGHELSEGNAGEGLQGRAE